MTRRTAVLVLVGMTLAMLVARLVLAAQGSLTYANDVAVALVLQSFTVVGAVLTLRVAGNAIGPLFLFVGIGATLQGLAEAVVSRAQAHHSIGGLMVHAAAWLSSWAWLPTLVVPLVFVTLLFPDGRVLSTRWRWVGRLGVVGMALVVVPLGVVAWFIATSELLEDSPVLVGWRRVVFGFAYVGIVVCLACAVLGLVSLLLRYRRGGEVTRQQLKLVLYAAVAAVALNVLGSMFSDVQNLLEPIGTALIPVAVGVAVLRYRLYDIDRIVSRTVSYAVVTGLLVGVYVGCVALTTGLLPFSSSLGVAASTLVAAALFQPLRRRVQSAVDRRFNRARYDAARTVDQFAVRLRDAVDVATVRDDLLRTVHTAVEPAIASLWVCGDVA